MHRRRGGPTAHIALGLLVDASVQQQLRAVRVTIPSGPHQRGVSVLRVCTRDNVPPQPPNPKRTRTDGGHRARVYGKCTKSHTKNCDLERYMDAKPRPILKFCCAKQSPALLPECFCAPSLWPPCRSRFRSIGRLRPPCRLWPR